MEIHDLRHPPRLHSGPRPDSAKQTLSPGQILKASVVRATEDQRAILRIANLEVEVRTPLTLKPGERLLLSVIKGGRLPQMLLLGGEAGGGGVEARALRAILPRQAPLGLLLERLRSLLSDPSATAPRPSAAERHRHDGTRHPTAAHSPHRPPPGTTIAEIARSTQPLPASPDAKPAAGSPLKPLRGGAAEALPPGRAERAPAIPPTLTGRARIYSENGPSPPVPPGPPYAAQRTTHSAPAIRTEPAGPLLRQPSAPPVDPTAGLSRTPPPQTREHVAEPQRHLQHAQTARASVTGEPAPRLADLLERLSGHALETPARAIPERLRQALDQSGLFLEAGLARGGAPVGSDFKVNKSVATS